MDAVYEIAIDPATVTPHGCNNPFDDTEVDLQSTFIAAECNASANITVLGFYDGDAYRVRFAPSCVGAWTYLVTVSRNGSTTRKSHGLIPMSRVSGSSPGESHHGFACSSGSTIVC